MPVLQTLATMECCRMLIIAYLAFPFHGTGLPLMFFTGWSKTTKTESQLEYSFVSIINSFCQEVLTILKIVG